MTDPHQPSPTTEANSRRTFFAKAATIVIGGLITVFPFAAGLRLLLDPLRRRGESVGWLRIAPLSAVPDDGVPRQFSVVADRQDAWTHFPQQPIGAVYVRRLAGSDTVEAFNAICPHAGCFVAYAAARRVFQCPCHNSAFALDGAIIPPSPSPRPLDSLEAKIVEQAGTAYVMVKFENYYAGIREKVPRG